MNNTKHSRFKLVLFIAVASCSLENGAADMQYRWTNERGETIYSDRPPPSGVEHETIDMHPGLNYVEPGEPPMDKPVESTTSAEGSSSEAAESEKNPALCEKAKMNLIALENQVGLTVRNEQGQTKTLSEEDLEYAMVNARQQIEQNCE